MPLVGEVGVLVTRGLSVDWSVGDLFSLSDKVEDFYTSPLFSLADSRWCLVLSTNGVPQYPSSKGWVGLYLRRMDPGHPQTMKYTFGLKCSDGVEKKIELDGEFSTKDVVQGFGKCWSRSELSDEKATLLPNDVLTVTCELRSGALSVVKACADNGLFDKDVDSLMGQIKTLQKTVENYELESENYKKQIRASEKEKSSIAEQYKYLLNEKLNTVSGLEKDNEQLKKELESLRGQIKTQQKTVENYELESENYKKQISASEREKASIAEQYKCLLEEKLTVVSGLERDNEQLKKEVESLMEQIKTQKTVGHFELELENYKKQISAVESFGQRKVIYLGFLLFIVFQILYFMIRTGLSKIGTSL